MGKSKKHTVNCPYCAHTQTWEFVPDSDFESMDDILKYDFEYPCNKCGCSVRVNEALNHDELQKYGFAS